LKQQAKSFVETKDLIPQNLRRKSAADSIVQQKKNSNVQQIYSELSCWNF